MHEFVIAFDIGNSMTDAGLVNVHTHQVIQKHRFTTKETVARFENTINQLLHFSDLKSCLVCIACVSPEITKSLKSTVATMSSRDTVFVHHTDLLPITFGYTNPQQLGTDRIANALGSYALYPQKNCLIICSGTAITVDLLSASGVHEGGIIMPGVHTQLKSLSVQTSALPEVQPVASTSFPGRSTEECIQSGVLLGIAGSLDRFVLEAQKKFGNDLIVLTCGGNWHLHEKLVGFSFVNIPDLTLLGTAMLGSFH
jgi:type III pantothenate kinase